MPLTRANGILLHTQVLGVGRPLVMLHGLFVGSLATWYYTAARALARSHRVLLYDLRGHGLSQRVSGGYDLATMTADLACLLKDLDQGPVSLVGHSYGGLVALRFALDRPERVSRLALVDVPLPPSRLEELSAFMAQTPERMLEALPQPLRRSLLDGGRRAKRLRGSLEFLARETSLVTDLRAEEDLSDETLSRLDREVLCVYGERSSCRPVGERLAHVLPRATLAVLPGGHYLPVETPGPLSSKLVEFLDG